MTTQIKTFKITDDLEKQVNAFVRSIGDDLNDVTDLVPLESSGMVMLVYEMSTKAPVIDVTAATPINPEDSDPFDEWEKKVQRQKQELEDKKRKGTLTPPQLNAEEENEE